MAFAADFSSIPHSPGSARPSRGPSFPWTHVLRGDPEPAIAVASPSSPPPSAAAILPPEPSDRSPPVPSENVASSSGTVPQSSMPSDEPEHGCNGNAAASASVSVSSSSSSSAAAAARGKKPAWQRPSNGSIEVGPVMGAVSWPPLSESTKASPKSSSPNTLKGSSDGTVSAPPGPVISTPPRPNSNNMNLNSTTNHVASPVRQKPNKRGSGSGSSSGTPVNGAPALQSPPPASAAATQITPDRETIPEPSPGDLPSKSSGNSNWDRGTRGGGFAPQQHGWNDHHRGYGGNRRGGGGGSHRGSFGSRRDQDRGSFVWGPRGFGSRDASAQQRGVRPYPRPPPPPFLSPPPQVRPFGNPVGYPDMPSPVYYVATPPPPETLSGLPFIAHPAAAPPAVFSPAAIDPQRAMLLKQINYYFSSDNLCKDIYLRRNMDEQGWVPITLIAGFNRVKQFTNNIQYILDTIRLSDVVEVQGEKIRKRNDWMNWVLPPSPNHFGTVPGLQSPATSDYDTLVAQLQAVELEGASNHNSMRGSTHTEVVLIRSASGNLNNQLHVVGDLSGDGNGQVTGHINSDYSKSGRSLVRSDTL
ncbi:la-related protein 1C-like [Phoenix dactylifera]|uniref:La-related protein 1C-like n=1 Tax=Phoenix dactylifera TaxID=42345 RepID=A0A8B7CYN3_PHODC|nr:la-related protein 1C-like [Phoenix dactylifera]